MTPVTEEELIEKAKAPRITLEMLEANIKSYNIFNVYEVIKASGVPVLDELKTLTMCVIVLNNGYTVTGQSACADPNNYNKDIGDRLALDDAKKKIWALMGYSLKQELYINGDNTFMDRLAREAKELNDKLSKLEVFFEGITYKGLPVYEQKILVTQRDAMAEYHQTLKKRIALHEKG